MLMRIFIAHVRPHVDAKEGPSDPRLKQVCPYPTSQPIVLGGGGGVYCIIYLFIARFLIIDLHMLYIVEEHIPPHDILDNNKAHELKSYWLT